MKIDLKKYRSLCKRDIGKITDSEKDIWVADFSPVTEEFRIQKINLKGDAGILRLRKKPYAKKTENLPRPVKAFGGIRSDGSLLNYAWGFRDFALKELKNSPCKVIPVLITPIY